MAPPLITLSLSLLLLPIIIITTSTASDLLQSQEPITTSHKLNPMRQKLSHLSFYWHDILSGRNPTSVPIARGPTTNSSATGFGTVFMIDDPLTAGPTMRSALVGRAQGLYASASQETVGLMMAMNFAFTDGKYNGSTITVLGRNEVFTGVREMPVVGGSGLFRFAAGYVQARTHKVDISTGDAVVRYDCHVLHY